MQGQDSSDGWGWGQVTVGRRVVLQIEMSRRERDGSRAESTAVVNEGALASRLLQEMKGKEGESVAGAPDRKSRCTDASVLSSSAPRLRV